MITYRANERGTLHAAYCGAVRIGYVEDRERFTAAGWRWQLIMLQPEGGAYWGFVNDEIEAKQELEKAFTHWMSSAGLIKENSDDPRRTDKGIRVAAQRDIGGDEATPQPKRGERKNRGVRADRPPVGRKPAARPESKRGRSGNSGKRK